jgi:hypothetical protein
MSMSSPALTFDRLAYIDRLEIGGVEKSRARARAEALDAPWRDSVATKSDVEELLRDIRAVGTRLEAKIETTVAIMKVDLLRWLIVTQFAFAGVFFAAVKFIR